jgi:hypothetical protein
MSDYTHPRLEFLFTVAEALGLAARELAREAETRIIVRRRPRRGATLRPSVDTPLWNALAAEVKPHLRRRGARALLAREMGVHRARMHEYFDKPTAMPDAERALELLLWLSRQPRGTTTRGVKS